MNDASLHEWLMLWTPTTIATFVLKVGPLMVVLIGFFASTWRHGWPWFRERGR